MRSYGIATAMLLLLACGGGSRGDTTPKQPGDEDSDVDYDDRDTDFPGAWAEFAESAMCDVTDSTQTFTVVTWNILKRRLKTRQDSGAFAKLVRIVKDELRPDLLIIQEATQNGDEVRELRAQLGADFNLLRSVSAGGESLAVIYNKNVLIAIPAPDAGESLKEDVGLQPVPTGGTSMVRQPFVVYVRVLGASPNGPKYAFDGYFMNAHTRPRARLGEMDLLAANHAHLQRQRDAEAAAGRTDNENGEPDIIVVGDLNRTPTSSALQDNFPTLVPVLRIGPRAGRTRTTTGTLYTNASVPLVDNFLIPPSSYEDFVSGEVIQFDTAAANQPPRDISDHRPLKTIWCKYNDTDP